MQNIYLWKADRRHRLKETISTSVWVVGGFVPRKESVFAISILSFPSLMKWTRYSMESLEKVNLLIFSVTSMSSRSVKISSTC